MMERRAKKCYEIRYFTRFWPSVRNARSLANLQRGDLLAFEPEDVLKSHWAVRKITGHLADNDRLAIPLDDIDGLNCVAVFLLRLYIPLLDGGSSFDGSAFISHNGMLGEALKQGFCVIAVLGGEIGRHRFG